MQIKRKRDEQNILTLKHQQEREDLEKNMTLRRDKKKESLTRKMLEHERYFTHAHLLHRKIFIGMFYHTC